MDHTKRQPRKLGWRVALLALALAVVIDLVTVVALARWAGTVWSATLR